MNCPKCDHMQQDAIECEQCGIVFSRYYSWLESRKSAEDSTHTISNKAAEPVSIFNIFFYIRPDENYFFLCGRLAVLLGLVGWSYAFITSPIESNYAGRSFMHLVNLPFHEAGHIIFRPFGDFMTSLGGTIAQFFFPLLCLVVLLFQTRDTFGASVCLWWFGQNFFDIAPYVNDARSLTLPLVGGNYGHSSPYGFHDWEYILTESGFLHYDHLIARTSVTIGTMTFLLAFSWATVVLLKQYKYLRE